MATNLIIDVSINVNFMIFIVIIRVEKYVPTCNLSELLHGSCRIMNGYRRVELKKILIDY